MQLSPQVYVPSALQRRIKRSDVTSVAPAVEARLVAAAITTASARSCLFLVMNVPPFHVFGPLGSKGIQNPIGRLSYQTPSDEKSSQRMALRIQLTINDRDEPILGPGNRYNRETRRCLF